MTTLTEYHAPAPALMPGSHSRDEALKIARESGIEIQIDIDGEPWILKAANGDVFARLADDSDRRAGRRCRECGRPHSRIGGFYRDRSWLCSTACLADHQDHQQETL